jgi:hypothetical protein
MTQIYTGNGNFQNITNGRYPFPPAGSSQGNVCFPTDLVNNNRNFYINLQLATYDRTSVFNSPTLVPGPSLALPIPLKINDTQTVIWEQASLSSQSLSLLSGGLSLAVSAGSKAAAALSTVGGSVSQLATAAGNFGSYAYGISANPALVMLFKTQNFKEHQLEWILAPNNTQDSQALQTIVKSLKNAMLPTNQGLVLGYPQILIPSLSVGTYTYNFKPCAINSLTVDWSAGATPAFFTDQTPALVSLTMSLKEIELWWQGDIQ